MVIVKSMARLSGNIVTLLKTARELKLPGIDVFFEKRLLYGKKCRRLWLNRHSSALLVFR